MPLPAREKPIKDRKPIEGRYPMSILCPGEGCRERLGVRTPWIYEDVNLEPGYTQDRDDRYPPGEWWWRPYQRPEHRGRAARRWAEAGSRPASHSEGSGGSKNMERSGIRFMVELDPNPRKRREFVERHTVGRGDPWEPVRLPAGKHIVNCRSGSCGGKAIVEAR